MTEEFFEKLLNFGKEWKVERIDFNENNEVDIYLKWNLEAHKKANKYTYEFVHDYRKYRRWRHLDILQFKTFINAKIPRIKSKDVTIQSVKTPWASEGNRHTFLFEIIVIDWLLATKNQTKTAQMLRCGFNFVNRIIHTSSQRGIERRDKDIVYEQLSLDEKAFQKGHNYVTVLSDSKAGIIIDVVKDRTKKSCKTLLNNSLS
jgi:transposase